MKPFDDMPIQTHRTLEGECSQVQLRCTQCQKTGKLSPEALQGEEAGYEIFRDHEQLLNKVRRVTQRE